MNEDADFDEYAKRIQTMLENDKFKKFNYYFRFYEQRSREMLDQAYEFLWGGDIEDLLDVIVEKYYELVEPRAKDVMFKIRFNIPYYEGGSVRMNLMSLKNMFNMMNSLVPDGRNLYLKEVVFDWIEDLVCDTENLTSRYLLHHKFNKFKAAYTVLEIEQFMSDENSYPFSGRYYRAMSLAFGYAVAHLDCFLEFDLEHKNDAYHSIGQAFIQKYSAHYIQFMGDYKRALKMALTKWKKGDPSDHAEMATFLVNRPEFAHLKKNKVLEILKPFAKRRKKLRGVKKETKKMETKE